MNTVRLVLETIGKIIPFLLQILKVLPLFISTRLRPRTPKR